MGELTQYIPQKSETVKQIYEWHEKKEKDNPHHGRLGASIIGHECQRYLWYSFRQCFKSTFKGRMLRLFETGHLEEERFIKELRGIGCTVLDVDQETNKQFEFLELGGHFVCHPDAVALGLPEAPRTWHGCEFKTMGGEESQSKDFEKVKKTGVQKAKPIHFAQMQMGMGLGKLTRYIYLCKKKATDEIHSERLRYDSKEFKRFLDKAESVITAQTPLERISNRPDYYECNWCNARDICWPEMDSFIVPLPKKTCRTCLHATPVIEKDSNDAKWSCAGNLKKCGTVNFQEQMEACDKHLLIPALIHFADPVDAGTDWVEYQNKKSKVIWRHGNGSDGTWSTDNLINGDFKHDPVPFAISELPLVHQYPWQDSELLWNGEPDMIRPALRALNLDVCCSKEPDSKDEVDGAYACEYKDENILIVQYQKDNYAAIWRGKI